MIPATSRCLVFRPQTSKPHLDRIRPTVMEDAIRKCFSRIFRLNSTFQQRLMLKYAIQTSSLRTDIPKPTPSPTTYSSNSLISFKDTPFWKWKRFHTAKWKHFRRKQALNPRYLSYINVCNYVC